MGICIRWPPDNYNNARFFNNALFGGAADGNGKRKIVLDRGSGFRNSNRGVCACFFRRCFEREPGLSSMRGGFTPPRTVGGQALCKFAAPGSILLYLTLARGAAPEPFGRGRASGTIHGEICLCAGIREFFRGRKIDGEG